MSAMQTRADLATRQFFAERVFDAPRTLVFEAFTKPEHLVHWWGPKGWTLPVCELDFRVGGKWHYCMKGPEDMESWGLGVYEEINAPESFVYRDHFSNAEGMISEGMPGMLIRVEFVEEPGNKTRVVSTTLFNKAEELEQVIEMGMVEGLTETWDRLVEYLTTR